VTIEVAADERTLEPDEVEALPLKHRYACPVSGCDVTGISAGGIKRHITKVHRVDGREYDIKPRTNITYGATVYGPDDVKVRVLFYPTGAIRMRVNDAAPMAITEAFLSGESNVIIKLVPLT